MDSIHDSKLSLIFMMTLALIFGVAAIALWLLVAPLMDQRPKANLPTYKSVSETVAHMDTEEQSDLLSMVNLAEQALEDSLAGSRIHPDLPLMHQLDRMGTGNIYLLFAMLDRISQTDLRPHAELIFRNKEATFKDYQRFFDTIATTIDPA